MSETLVAIFSGGGTGGHLYPALALAGRLAERRSDVLPFFLGAERGVEARVLPERGLPHLLLPVRGLDRERWMANVGVVAALLNALGRVASLFQRLRPALVVVTGGYAGGPAGLLAVLTRTPLVLQEQNSVPGVTTRALAPFAAQVHVAFPEAVDALPARSRSRTRVTGNPVEPPAPRPREEAAAFFDLRPDRLVILVVGGSQGSLALNRAILDAVAHIVRRDLPARPEVQFLWSTGPTHLAEIQNTLAELGSPDWVRAVGYIDRMELALSVADLAVSRAGAMATSEFLAWGVPAVLVPLPTAAADHQTRNARTLEEAGAAVHLAEEEATPERLLALVAELTANRDLRTTMASAARRRGRPRAALEIAEALEALLPPARPRSTGGAR